MALESTWFDQHAGALSALAAIGTLIFTLALVLISRHQTSIAETQSKIAARQADIAEKQVALQAEVHHKEGPVLALYFNGFQSQPHDPKNEMLWLMVSVGNEGRRDVRVTLLELEVLEPEPKREGYSTYALHAAESIKHGKDARGYYAPTYGSWGTGQTAGGVVNSHDARSFYVALPANGGYENWKRVRLRVSGIGVEPATKEVDWNLYWLTTAKP